MSAFVYIILPVYNGEKYLLQQLMSIYFQDYKNWHLIIINDGSTDSTKDIINKFVSNYKLQKRVTLINQPNKGLNKSIENGLIEAKKIIELGGNVKAYITYCDADDLMMTNRLSYQINYMEKNKNCDLSYHDLILIDENNSILNNSFLKMINGYLINIKNDNFCEFCISNHIPATTIMFKSEKIESLVPFPRTYPFQDRRTSLIFSSNNWKIKNINKSLGFYRRYKNQMSDTSNKQINLVLRFTDFIGSLEEITKRTKDIKRISEANEYIDYYKNRIKWIKNNDNKFVQLIKIIRYNPRIMLRRILALKNYL